jgi:EmrB/QacA subfamily drug resistance transporter
MESQRQTRLVLLATIGAAFMAGLDLFVVNVAFDDLGADLGIGTPDGPTAGDLSWVLNAYAVVYAALLVPFGRLADRYGRRLVFVAGLSVFTLSSLACALSADVWTLVAARTLQAVGAAAMTPASLGILLGALPPERRVGGVRLWAATGAIAAAIGPTVGGMLTQASWHWVFLINLPVGALLVVLALTQITESRTDQEEGLPDLLGAVLFATAVGLLALGLVKSPDWGWGDGRTVAALAGSLLAATAFTVQSRRHLFPVVNPALMRVTTFRWTTVSMLAFNAAFAANLLVGVLWLQQVWGYSVLTTGFAVAAGPLVVPITAALSHRLLPDADHAHLVIAGSLLAAAGVVVMVLSMGTEPAYLTAYLPGWLIGAMGVGLALPNLLAGGTRDLPAQEFATGSAVVSMARQIGFVVGVSVLFAIVGDLRGPAAVDAFQTAWWVAAGILLAGAAAAVGMRTVRSDRSADDRDTAPLPS